MLKTKAIFERKTDSFVSQECLIEKIVRLDTDEYNRFRQNMLAEYDFIRDNIDMMRCDENGVYHCLLVLGEGTADGVLIESEGYAYGRYTAFLPNAADFLAAQPEPAQEIRQEESPDMNLNL